jgi:DNA repair exonuclease SbcCD ATPase subunit
MCSRQTRRILACHVLAALLMPGMAAAQRGDERAQFDARMNTLQRSLAELSAQIEQLSARDRELQQQLERMRANYDQRLEGLERGAGKVAPPTRSRP